MAGLHAFLETLLTTGRQYYCHKCERVFRSGENLPTEELESHLPNCIHCHSEFVEGVEDEEPRLQNLIPHLPPRHQAPVDDTDDPEPERLPRRRRVNVHIGMVRNGETQTMPVFPQQFFQEHMARTMGPVSEESQTAGRGPNSTASRQPASQPSQTSSQTNPTSSQTRETFSTSSSVDPPEASQHPTGPQAAPMPPNLQDLHMSVGMPWYFMLHHRQHAQRARGQQQQQAGPLLHPPHPFLPHEHPLHMISPMFLFGGGGGGEGLHSAPGDYVWGPQGIDNMISQMLASLEDPGPPPAEQNKIDSLPTVVSTAESLKSCSLCSVCKDDFTEGESLIQLPCQHLYHKDCIFPWLKLHDTCPTCRFHLNTGQQDTDKGPF